MKALNLDLFQHTHQQTEPAPGSSTTPKIISPARLKLAGIASYIADRLDLVEDQIKYTREAMISADLSPEEFNQIREKLSELSEIIDLAHDTPDQLYRLLYR